MRVTSKQLTYEVIFSRPISLARPLKLNQAGGYYHVFARGIERRVIFPGEVDREDFLERLGEIPGRFAVGVHAFVLMDNHYHLLLRPENLNLSQAVQWLNVGFSIWFNKKHRRVGPLFQGRFKSVLIGEEEQLPEINAHTSRGQSPTLDERVHSFRSSSWHENSDRSKLRPVNVRCQKDKDWKTKRAICDRKKSRIED
jgi:REP element-mobilizing transposase RayT